MPAPLRSRENALMRSQATPAQMNRRATKRRLRDFYALEDQQMDEIARYGAPLSEFQRAVGATPAETLENALVELAFGGGVGSVVGAGAGALPAGAGLVASAGGAMPKPRMPKKNALVGPPVPEPWRERITPKRRLKRIGAGPNAGQYIGAPAGVKTPRQFDRLAAQYADRIEEALDAGVAPGYFYEGAGRTINTLAGGHMPTAENIKGSSALVSAGNKVVNERSMSARALEQADMGQGTPGGYMTSPSGERVALAARKPMQAGQYRRQDRQMERMVEATRSGRPASDVVEGPKIEEYGAAAAGDVDALGANDRWEVHSVYGTEPKVSSAGEAQHEFLHSLRLRAAEMVQQRRGGQLLRPKEAQELNWAVAKARYENKTPQWVAENETWQGNLPRQTTYQTWETAPGSRAEHFQDADPTMRRKLHQRAVNVLVDEQGRDNLLAATGTSQQMPVTEGAGVYYTPERQLETNPSITSRSVGAQPYHTIAPVTSGRVAAQEKIRATILGQNAVAATMIGKGGKKDAIRVNKPLSAAGSRRLVNELEKAFGDDAMDKLAIINTEDGGFAVTYHNMGNAPDPKFRFSDKFKRKVEPALKVMLGDDAEFSRGTLGRQPDGGGTLLFDELPWGGKDPWSGDDIATPSPVTTDMLQAIDNPDIPLMRQHADSPQARALMGEMHDAYTELKAAGGIPNDKIMALLQAWKTGGLKAVRAGAAKGLFPAIAVGVLSRMAPPEDDNRLRPGAPGA